MLSIAGLPKIDVAAYPDTFSSAGVYDPASDSCIGSDSCWNVMLAVAFRYMLMVAF